MRSSGGNEKFFSRRKNHFPTNALLTPAIFRIKQISLKSTLWTPGSSLVVYVITRVRAEPQSWQKAKW
jgi:hypothetical protein